MVSWYSGHRQPPNYWCLNCYRWCCCPYPKKTCHCYFPSIILHRPWKNHPFFWKTWKFQLWYQWQIYESKWWITTYHNPGMCYHTFEYYFWTTISILDFTLLNNGSLYLMLSSTRMLDGIPPFLTTLSQKMNNGLMLYLTMLKIFHLYLIYMGITIDDTKLILSLSL